MRLSSSLNTTLRKTLKTRSITSLKPEITGELSGRAGLWEKKDKEWTHDGYLQTVLGREMDEDAEEEDRDFSGRVNGEVVGRLGRASCEDDEDDSYEPKEDEGEEGEEEAPYEPEDKGEEVEYEPPEYVEEEASYEPDYEPEQVDCNPKHLNSRGRGPVWLHSTWPHARSMGWKVCPGLGSHGQSRPPILDIKKPRSFLEKSTPCASVLVRSRIFPFLSFGFDEQEEIYLFFNPLWRCVYMALVAAG